MVNNSQLQSLLARCWNENNKIQNNPGDPLHPIVVPGSIPVLWFGDLEAYSASPKRVVTVGINPSRKEFGALSEKVFTPAPTLRFPLPLSPAVPDFKDYVKAMGAYYRTNPLKSWFWPNEAALNACGATYGGAMTSSLGAGATSTGLHIDVKAPLATNQWGKLLPGEQDELSRRFGGLFYELVQALDPEVLIIPVKLSVYLPSFKGTVLSTSTVSLSKGDRHVVKYEGVLCGKKRTLIEGWNGTTPFPFADKGAIFDLVK